MPSVLVIGATGNIGLEFADALVRSGLHTVYGLARTEQKAQLLAQREITPVLGSVEDSNSYLSLIEKANIDIVVDAAGVHKESNLILDDLNKIGKARLRTAEKAGVKVPKLGFVYLSGTWVHGSSTEPVTDTMPVGVKHAANQPPEIVGWRPELEQRVLQHRDTLDVLIVRPSLVYGRAMKIWSPFFEPIVEAVKHGKSRVNIPADPLSRPGLVHVDDVATVLRAAVEKLSLIAGTGEWPIFDAVSSVESMRDIVEFAAKELGFKGEVNFTGPGDDLLMQARSTSINADGARAKSVLGWEPKRVGMVQRMRIYTMAWKSHV